MSLLDKPVGGKSLKGWMKFFIYLLIVYIIILIIMNVVRWLFEERYKSDKKSETVDITGYTGDIFNPFNIIKDIQLLLGA